MTYGSRDSMQKESNKTPCTLAGECISAQAVTKLYGNEIVRADRDINLMC